MLKSPRCVINCSRWRLVPRIQRWDANPTVDISPWILSGITPTQFHLLYKAPGEIIFPYFTSFQALQRSQTLRPLRLSRFPNFLSPFLQKSSNLLKVQGSIHVLILVSFFFSICKYLVWGTILQAYSLWNVVPSLEAFHTGRRIYEVLEPTHLGELKGCKRNFQRKKTKNRRPKRLDEEKKA